MVVARLTMPFISKVGGQAVLGRQDASPTPWLTERHGSDPTCQGVASGDRRVHAVGREHGDARRVERPHVAGRGGDGGGQVDDAVHQHQREEADAEIEGVHHEPVLPRLQQPDDDRRDKDHEDVDPNYFY